MTATAHHSTHLLRRLGTLIVMGVGATFVGLGATGYAAADTWEPPPIPAPEPYFDPSESSLIAGDSWSPPRLPDLPFSPASGGGFRLGEDISLNPQPLPPGPDRGVRVGLNPQPLPPGPDRWSRIALNPQPLPPAPELRLDRLRIPGF